MVRRMHVVGGSGLIDSWPFILSKAFFAVDKNKPGSCFYAKMQSISYANTTTSQKALKLYNVTSAA